MALLCSLALPVIRHPLAGAAAAWAAPASSAWWSSRSTAVRSSSSSSSSQAPSRRPHLRMMAAAAATSTIPSGEEDPSIGKKPPNPFNFSWQQTMLRIKDPAVSLPFYEDVLGFRRVHEYHFETFSLYFLATPKPEELPQVPSVVPSKESEAYLWSMQGTVVELTWNHGTEKQADFQYNNGNVEPNRGFGHLAIAVDDVYQACAKLEEQGVSFQKKPDEGRMKGLAFIKDPDGYWIEVISRSPGPRGPSYPSNLAQTMLRVKDPAKSLGFYRDLLGMTLVATKHFSDFSLYFLAQHPDLDDGWNPVLELTHNHGTESDPGFAYHNGNKEPRGFGHTGFLVDDLEASCKFLEEKGVAFQKKPSEGNMRGLAFVRDPDDYWVEIVQRGLTI